jgi:tRNA pseudouridine38-40 synthase
VTVEAAAESFLPRMVRNLVGTLLLVGTHRLDVGDVSEILAQRDPNRTGPTASPQGLCLTRVWYD